MSQINYIYWKTGQGVNFGSCETRVKFMNKEKKLKRKGYFVEIEAETPELRAEQLQRIREQK